MLDASLDVPGTLALADEIVALLVHTTLLDDLDINVEEVSHCTVLYYLVRYASCKCSSHNISSAFHVLLDSSSISQNLCSFLI
jgi:hypothetical protein